MAAAVAAATAAAAPALNAAPAAATAALLQRWALAIAVAVPAAAAVAAARLRRTCGSGRPAWLLGGSQAAVACGDGGRRGVSMAWRRGGARRGVVTRVGRVVGMVVGMLLSRPPTATAAFSDRRAAATEK